MDDGLKQRLIGAVVLLALAVIFVPVIFDREQIQTVDRRTQIPPAPEIPAVTVAEPETTEEIEPAPAVDEIFLPDEDAALTEEQQAAVQSPALDDQGVPHAWVLQVASYKNAERAEEMQQQLAADGYSAYTRLVRADQGEMTRLFVGPKLDKGQLLSDQNAIEEKYRVSTLMLKFEP